MSKIEDRILELQKPKGPVITSQDLEDSFKNNYDEILNNLAENLKTFPGHYHISYVDLVNILLNRKMLSPSISYDYKLNDDAKYTVRSILEKFDLVVQPTKHGGTVCSPDDYVDFGTLSWFQDEIERNPQLYESKNEEFGTNEIEQKELINEDVKTKHNISYSFICMIIVIILGFLMSIGSIILNLYN